MSGALLLCVFSDLLYGCTLCFQTIKMINHIQLPRNILEVKTFISVQIMLIELHC